MKASDIIVRALENEGVEYVFGLPGEENLDFLESLRNSHKIRFVLTRHEQGAGFMAATYGRLTGRPGVCLATLGPGATNMVTPAAYAQLGAMPLVIITGQKPIKKGKQGKFQIIDIVEMTGPLTKFTGQVAHAEHIPSIVRETFRIAKQERPGAVHIELPEDISTGTGIRCEALRRGRFFGPVRRSGADSEGGRHDRNGQEASTVDRCGREQKEHRGCPDRIRGHPGHSVLQHSNGQGRNRRKAPPLSGNGRPFGLRHPARCNRQCGPYCQRRP